MCSCICIENRRVHPREILLGWYNQSPVEVPVQMVSANNLEAQASEPTTTNCTNVIQCRKKKKHERNY